MYIMYVKNYITNSHNTLLMVILFFIFLENTILLTYLFLTEAHRTSLTRDRTRDSCSGSTETSPLHHQGSPQVILIFLFEPLPFFPPPLSPYALLFLNFFILKFFKPSESCKSSTMNHSLSTFSPCWIKLKITQCSILNATGHIY